MRRSQDAKAFSESCVPLLQCTLIRVNPDTRSHSASLQPWSLTHEIDKISLYTAVVVALRMCYGTKHRFPFDRPLPTKIPDTILERTLQTTGMLARYERSMASLRVVSIIDVMIRAASTKPHNPIPLPSYLTCHRHRLSTDAKSSATLHISSRLHRWPRFRCKVRRRGVSRRRACGQWTQPVATHERANFTADGACAACMSRNREGHDQD